MIKQYSKRDIKKIATRIKNMSVKDIRNLIDILISFEKKGNYTASGIFEYIRMTHKDYQYLNK